MNIMPITSNQVYKNQAFEAKNSINRYQTNLLNRSAKTDSVSFGNSVSSLMDFRPEIAKLVISLDQGAKQLSPEQLELLGKLKGFGKDITEKFNFHIAPSSEDYSDEYLEVTGINVESAIGTLQGEQVLYKDKGQINYRMFIPRSLKTGINQMLFRPKYENLMFKVQDKRNLHKTGELVDSAKMTEDPQLGEIPIEVTFFNNGTTLIERQRCIWEQHATPTFLDEQGKVLDDKEIKAKFANKA